MISEIKNLLRTLKSHDLVGRRANIALKPFKDILQNRTLYIVFGIWVQKMFKIMMILARLNLAFSVTMSNFFPNTLYEIYLDVLDIGEV